MCRKCMQTSICRTNLFLPEDVFMSITATSFFSSLSKIRSGKISFLKRKIFTLDKRERFALQTLILTAGVLASQQIWDDYRFFMVAALSFVCYLITAWSLTEDIKGTEWLMLFILPVAFVASVSLFYFLLPARIISKFVITILFTVGLYAILLIENIYNVASIRTIQLLRAAQSVGLLLTLVVLYLYVNVMYSVRMPFFMNILSITPVVFLLSLQSLWSIKLEEKISGRMLLYCFIISLMIGELVFVFSFWPISVSSFSLVVTASYYSLVGLFQQRIQDRLFKNSIREYIIVFIFTVFLIFLSARWG
jgi:hypothetical protein